MAIRGGFLTKSLVYLPEAYVNIPQIILNKQIANGISGFVGSMKAFVYKDEEAYKAGGSMLDMFEVTFELDENATIAWAYSLLKSRNLIENAEDLL